MEKTNKIYLCDILTENNSKPSHWSNFFSPKKNNFLTPQIGSLAFEQSNWDPVVKFSEAPSQFSVQRFDSN